MTDPTNTDRALRAEAAFEIYIGQCNSHDEDDSTNFRDLLCDLRHLADIRKLDFDNENRIGAANYEAELEEASSAVFHCPACGSEAQPSDAGDGVIDHIRLTDAPIHKWLCVAAGCEHTSFWI